MASACLAYFLLGWGDGLTGTVLPYFEAEFDLSFMISSLLFAGSTIGFAIGTLSIERTTRMFGLIYQDIAVPPFIHLTLKLWLPSTNNKSITGYCSAQSRIITLLLGCLAHVAFLILMGSSKGFSTIFIAYVTAGFARSWITATLNAYIASTPMKGLGFILASWSIGAFVSPLVCQTLVAKGIPWSHFYFGSLVISFMNVSLLLYAFLPSTRERRGIGNKFAVVGVVVKDGTVASSGTPTSTEKGEDAIDAIRNVATSKASSKRSGLCRALKSPYVWIFSVYLWIYSGSETTTAGFMTTYLLDVRHANPDTAGYVTSGFWGGEAMSRLVWGCINPRLTFTQRKFILTGCINPELIFSCLLRCVAMSLAMNLLILFIKSSTANAVSASIIGLAFGPIFPGTLGLSNDIMDQDLRMISMAVMSAFGSFGSALYPFITGILANVKGPRTLVYVTVAQTGALLLLWVCFPSKQPTQNSTLV
ncbi:MFS general substrate transporter [Neolentinus lepideus HHB14362 ss-1]|uniref:MFS general substrate transporter n=1 Tax=Neolentinus lepideus HHB14362 ss-1 TaxID=1314782 RepID=A0A165N9W0_9AGAM|nr:MFS general substrate transporter [Neolentinus lepideus HHB14362 ss-1]